MKILHIINSLELGGAENLLVDSLMYLKENHPDVENHILTLTEKGILSDQVDKNFFYSHFQLNRLNYFQVAHRVKAYIKQNNIHIIHAHLFESCIISRLTKTKGVKIINTYHSAFHHPQSLEYSIKKLIVDKLTIGKVDNVIFVSNRLKEIHCRRLKCPKNTFVITNFCNPRFTYNYQYKNDDELRLVAVGTLKPIKNHLLALKALSLLDNNKVSLDIFGVGELEEQMHGYIKEHKINAKLKGNQNINSSLLSKYDAFLMPSKNEGMPISLIEALTTGLPSLLNDLPELRETALDAALYFEKDSSLALCQVLNQILSNKSILKDLSRNAKSLASSYSINYYISKLLIIYMNKNV